MIKFDLRLKQETIDSIKELAEQESRSVSGMARKILEEYFKYRYEQGKGGIVYGQILDLERITKLTNKIKDGEYYNHKHKDTGEESLIELTQEIKVEENTLTIPVIKTDKNGNT